MWDDDDNEIPKQLEQEWKCGNCHITVTEPMDLIPDSGGCQKNESTHEHAWYKV